MRVSGKEHLEFKEMTGHQIQSLLVEYVCINLESKAGQCEMYRTVLSKKGFSLIAESDLIMQV
jgi:hypothetical protein